MAYLKDMTPDYIEPLTGYRAWRITGSKLFSPLARTLEHKTWYWELGVNQADCQKGQSHKAPDHNCSCGLYAYKAPHRCLSGLKELGCVIGKVRLWGVVEEHLEGYRSEFAKLEALYPSPYPEITEELEVVASLYQVPIIKAPEFSAGELEPLGVVMDHLK